MAAWMDIGFPVTSSSCGCATSPVGQLCVTVGGCGTDKAGLVGTTVSLSQSGTTVATATVDPTTLKACLPYSATGSYTLTVTPPPASATSSYAPATRSYTLGTGTSNVTIGLSPSPGWTCCSASNAMINIPMNTPLYLHWACGFGSALPPKNSTDACTWNPSPWTIQYIGNSTWAFSWSGCVTYASGPPSLPVNLTFNEPTATGCTGYAQCDPTYGFNGGTPSPAWPLVVTS